MAQWTLQSLGRGVYYYVLTVLAVITLALKSLRDSVLLLGKKVFLRSRQKAGKVAPEWSIGKPQDKSIVARDGVKIKYRVLDKRSNKSDKQKVSGGDGVMCVLVPRVVLTIPYGHTPVHFLPKR